jgi:hypothetical protein
MEKKFERMESKIDKIDERLDSIDKTLAVNTESLKEHMRRTEMLENTVIPIKTHVNQLQGGIKLLGIISLILGIVLSLYNLFG